MVGIFFNSYIFMKNYWTDRIRLRLRIRRRENTQLLRCLSHGSWIINWEHLGFKFVGTKTCV